MKSWKTPTTEQLEKAIALMAHGEHRRYFFDKLDNPNWIPLLKSKGFFKTPPPLNRNEEKGTIGFPPWSESKYLARMAAFMPDEVLNVIQDMEETENTRVHEDLVDAAINMPPEKAATLTEHIKKWVLSPYHFLLPKKVGDLIAHLARGGQKKEALDMANVLLEIVPDPKAKDKSFGPDPKPRFEEYDYEEVLKKDFPELVKSAGIVAFELLCNLLSKHTVLSRSRKADKGPEDHSYVWRPYIDKAQHLYAVRDALINAIRDAAKLLIDQNPKNISTVVEILETNQWHIFHRIALHLLTLYTDSSIPLVRKKLSDRALFNSYGVKSEYIRLAKSGATHLSDQERKTILSWINEGPDINQFKKSGLAWDGKEREQKEIDDYVKIWKRERMFWFADILSPELMAEYQTLIKEYGGEPPLFEFEGAKAGWVEPSTPKTMDEIKAMSFDELFKFLKDWQPEDNFNHGRPREGLAEVLSKVISEDPQKFAVRAQEFNELHFTYVKALIRGLRDALSQKKEFEWEAVVDLMVFVAVQPYKAMDQKIINESTLKYIKDDMTRLLEIGFHQDTKNFIPTNLRERVWEIITSLLKDPDPMVDGDGERLQREPISDSINSVRPLAFHTIIRYALWLRRNEEKLPGASKKKYGFKEMPEVQKALEEGLKDEREAVRSVYGQWFPWIQLLDNKWAMDNVSKIFMSEQDDTELKRTAWESYIVTVAPYDDVFNMLREQYVFAVKHLNEEIFNRKNQPEAEKALAQHLTTFYWRGKLLEQDTIWQDFWKNASLKLKGQALDYIGRSFEATKEAPPQDIKERAMRLWEARLQAAKSAVDKTSYMDEMASFGWWFTAEKFDPRWAVEQLKAALEINPHIDISHLVVKKLAKYTQQNPIEAMGCLSLLIKDDRDPWAIHMWKDEAKEVLALALEAEDPKAATLAETIIHDLGRRGHLDLRDLLKGR